MRNNTNITPQNIDSYDDFKKLVMGTNINSISLLATDYLNHFNEVIMLIDMIADMPECIEDITAWQPKSYQDHFRDSSFSNKDLAVAAYDHVPDSFRKPFETLVAQLNTLVLQVAEQLGRAIETNNHSEMQAAAQFGSEMRLLVEKIGGIINAETGVRDQADIDVGLSA